MWWTDQDSLNFINYGRYFVPERERQIDLISRLVPDQPGPFHVLDLACGEGLLSEAILARHPLAVVQAYDGSATMLQHTQQRLARFKDRFITRSFDLAERSWRRLDRPVDAVVSSLAIHHLDDEQKQVLYADLYSTLAPGGVLVVADLVEPADDRARRLAAEEWDEAVRRRSLALDRDERGFELFQQERWNLYRFPDPADKPSTLLAQLGWLAQAGFAGVDVYWLRAGHAVFGGHRPA